MKPEQGSSIVRTARSATTFQSSYPAPGALSFSHPPDRSLGRTSSIMYAKLCAADWTRSATRTSMERGLIVREPSLEHWRMVSHIWVTRPSRLSRDSSSRATQANARPASEPQGRQGSACRGAKPSTPSRLTPPPAPAQGSCTRHPHARGMCLPCMITTRQRAAISAWSFRRSILRIFFEKKPCRCIMAWVGHLARIVDSSRLDDPCSPSCLLQRVAMLYTSMTSFLNRLIASWFWLMRVQSACLRTLTKRLMCSRRSFVPRKLSTRPILNRKNWRRARVSTGLRVDHAMYRQALSKTMLRGSLPPRRASWRMDSTTGLR